MKTLQLIVLSGVLVFFSCQKKKDKTIEEPILISSVLNNGFPEEIQEINGYFYAGVKRYSNNNNYYFDTYSVLRDPSGNLITSYDHFKDNNGSNNNLGNISVGIVKFNGQALNITNFGTFISYSSHNQISLTSAPETAIWKTEGNGSFKALDLNVTRGFPVIVNTYTNTNQTYSLSINEGYQVVLGNLVSNYDSLIVAISGENAFNVAKKRLTAGASSVYFSKNDLSILSGMGPYGYLYICAYNYSNKITDNVVNVFELSNKLQVSMQIYP